MTPITLREHGVQLVKIGKIEMKRCDTEHQVINKLLRRYSTYYSDNFEVLHFVRVGNCHAAEKKIFDLLADIKHKREMYRHDPETIREAFEKVTLEFPSLHTLLCKSNVNVVSSANKKLRNASA
jgi:hypothetical protein